MMKPVDAYKFCPKCGGDLVFKEENVLACSNCEFKFYISPFPCNGVIIENEKGEILLVKRKFEPKKGYWDWPGGFIKPYESFNESVLREIKEELGVDIKIEKIIGVYEDTYEFQNVEEPILGIAVSAKIIGGALKPADDIIDYKFFSKDEVLKQKLAFTSISKGIKDYFLQITP